VQVWSEKGTVKGVLAPVLGKYHVGFMAIRGFGSATVIHDVAQSYHSNRPLHILYVGDFDPSGMFMSDEDLPNRFEKYGGDHIKLKRIALIPPEEIGLDPPQVEGMPSFQAKQDDTRWAWFVSKYGHQCWELDAMDPGILRDRVDAEIKALINWETWDRIKKIEREEQEELETIAKELSAKYEAEQQAKYEAEQQPQADVEDQPQASGEDEVVALINDDEYGIYSDWELQQRSAEYREHGPKIIDEGDGWKLYEWQESGEVKQGVRAKGEAGRQRFIQKYPEQAAKAKWSDGYPE
jgi:hypothetical protein